MSAPCDQPEATDNIQTDGIGFLFTQGDIDEFKAIMKEECGEVLSNREAWDRATDLVSLFRMLRGPIPEDPERNMRRPGVQTSSNLP